MTHAQATRILEAADLLAIAIGSLPKAEHIALCEALHAKEAYLFTALCELDPIVRRAQYQTAPVATPDTNPITI